MPDHVTQLVPALPPAVNGLGDYAAVLARGLRAQGVATRFATLAPAAGNVDGFAVSALSGGESRSLISALDGASVVLVHFSGYGYARWGLCFWLIRALAHWRGADRARRLITVFHELYATGAIWQTSFWTSPAQRRIARRLAAVSDAMVATSPQTSERLRAWEPNRRVEMLPVFSNIGELAEPAVPSSRSGVAVVFGGGRRARTWAAMGQEPDLLGHGLRCAGIDRFVDIGPAADAVPETFAGLPVVRRGALAAERVSEMLAGARVGITDYPRHVFTKSGVIASYLAHGLLCVNTSEVGDLPDDLAEGREFVHPTRLGRGHVDIEGVAAAGHSWYRSHDLGTTVSRLYELLT